MAISSTAMWRACLPIRSRLRSSIWESQAGNAIGKGMYGVDIKESNGKLYVIEVNDNPSLEGGEDAHYPDMFQKDHLLS